MRTQVIQALERLGSEAPWVVLLCPSEDSARTCGKDLAAALPSEATMGGRTARVGSHRISVASATSEVFIPLKQDFKVALIESGHPVSEVEKWITRSSGLMLISQNQMPDRSGH